MGARCGDVVWESVLFGVSFLCSCQGERFVLLWQDEMAATKMRDCELVVCVGGCGWCE